MMRPLTRAAQGLLRWRRRAPLVVGAVAALVIGLGSGVAWGYFTAIGSGSGVASVGTVMPVTVVAATGAPTSKLIPGASADLALTLNNPNSYSVNIVSITQNMSGSITSTGGIGSCSTTGVSVPSQTGLSITVASGSGVIIHIPAGASMSASSSSGCQGASFQIPVTITVHK